MKPNLDTFDENSIQPFYCGKMDVQCEHCHALHWEAEKQANSPKNKPVFGVCCSKGLQHIPEMPKLPPLLKDLFDRKAPNSKLFHKNIRALNSSLSMVSMGIDNGSQMQMNGRGVPIFKVNGQIYHRY